ncbi:MAG: acyl-ACP--UDP-N-acetylglucosamine O-acyltransferase [Kangiellaceae bacterium]|nr:acyl-ACP--UDP-N-acetylglucosamine O-acyltransferase [Kangiellaceae bacterium]
MIHPSAIVHPNAKLADGVEIGPYSIIDEHVAIGAGTIVGPHVVINGHTTIGENNHFYQFSSIGEANQDKKYRGEPTRTVIGNNNIIRESCTIHRGTTQDQQVTSIGNDNLLMAYTHVAHDCRIGNQIIIANSSNIAGHVVIDDWAILGGFSGIHQFCRIGAHSFLGIRSHVTQDILPFTLFAEGSVRSINVEGIKRRGFSKEDISLLRKSYKIIYRQGLRIEEAVEQIKNLSSESSSLDLMIEFIKSSQRGITR